MILRPALIQQRVDLRGANEIVLAESVNCVRPVRHGAVLVTEADVRMMIGSMGDPRHGIDAGRGVPIVVELERRSNRFAKAVPLPAAIALTLEFAARRQITCISTERWGGKKGGSRYREQWSPN